MRLQQSEELKLSLFSMKFLLCVTIPLLQLSKDTLSRETGY